MKYLFDTDHISFLQRRAAPEHAILLSRIAIHSPADFAVPIISLQEQAIGAHTYLLRARKSSDLVRGYSLFREILMTFAAAHVLHFDLAAASAAEDLRAHGVRIGAMDLRIAAIAMTNGLILLTRNTVDFGRVAGLTTEDWTF